ncbi:stress response protein nst1-like [Acropora millepora]|uniref:stress response protein nst1-like n=1 Tax=Acropora millepora TaxID=45264 RepID=UPI001CF164A9|nr:stress response protein nst1-like [Acropora millepora]
MIGISRTSRVKKAPTRFQDDDDFYLVKFEEDGVRRVLSRDKVRIDDEAVEAGATCQAYWEDSQIKGWFPAIILGFGDSYENLMKMMNQKKKRQANQDCLDQGKKNAKKGKKMNSKKQAIEKESTDHGETEKNRKEQEQEAKKRKKEEEKKKREAKQLQRKEQLLALQKQHQSARKHQSLTDEELSDSDDEYLPVSVDEDVTDSEHEEAVQVARKRPRKNCGTSAPGSSQLTNSNCTWQTTQSPTSRSFSPSPNNHLQQRQSPQTNLLSATSSNVNPYHRQMLPVNPSHKTSHANSAGHTPSRPVYPRHTPFDPANSDHELSPASPEYLPSTNPSHLPSCAARVALIPSSINSHHTPSSSPSLEQESSSLSRRRTTSPSLDCRPASLNRCHTPSPSANSGHRAHSPNNSAEEVDWHEEYQKLHVKYNALKEKVRFLEQSSQEGYTNEERPPPGIYAPSEAQKHNMIEVCQGSNVYWYLGNRNTALNNTKTAGELTAFLMDTFFSKEVMAVSNMNGGGKKGYQKLNPTILNAMRGFVQDESQYGKQAAMAFSKTVQDKCCGARRGVSNARTI